MKKRITSMFLVLFVMLSLLSGNVLASPASGSGTEKNPYLIATARDLKEFRDEVNKGAKKSTSALCAKLTANIDLSSLEGNWEPIGKMTNTHSDYVAYGGTFDGNGFTISGLSIDNNSTYQALFGYVNGGKIRNLTVSGSVKTSTGSSAYAAGIAAYSKGGTVENCVNQVTVTATAKGYIAGVVAYAYTGTSIQNCTNQGAINGSGDYVGGIAGSASAVTIENCINQAAVTNTGKPGGYSYNTGGIAGGVSTATSKIARCGNTGAISSTIKRTGGIAGSVAGTVESCFNTGDVTGIYGIGGIVGGFTGKDTRITDCYNWGDISCNTPTATFTDKNTKGVGGIAGDPSSNSNTGTVLTNCYNAGTLSNHSTTADMALGGVIGTSTANNYSGVGTKGLITAANCYYLEADGLQGDGANADAVGITAKSGEELKSVAMAEALGGSYIAQTGSYPMLGWQDPNAKYTVKFTLSPSTAKLTVKQGETVVDPEKDGSYLLKNGVYTYEVSAPECKTETGSFTVAYGGQNITVTLTEQLYDVVFTTVPADAELTVEGRTPMEDGRTYQLPKSGNPYKYQLSAFGYQEITGSFTVTGNKEADAQNITMASLAKQTVTFGAVTAADGKAITPTIAVTCPAWPKESLKAEEGGSYQLPAGDYQYVISCSGYKTVKGSFSVKDEAVQIPAVTLEVQTAWDGATLTEPQKDADGVYQIGSPDELMWFDKKATLNDSAVLTADITINEDVKGDASGLYAWIPVGVGTSTATRYTGSFDGQGHTVSGLYVSASKNVGMFGYAGTGSKISNLTISDSVIKASGNNAGAIAGDAYIIENCHVTESVEVTGTGYVGGVAGYVDQAISTSSNAGTVTATGNNVGGVVGQVQANGSTAMTECYNVGSVSGSSLVGGLAGNLYNGGTISDCYNTGSVTATAASGMAGGIVGKFRYGIIKNVYTNVKPTANTAGSVAGSLEWSGGQKTLNQVYIPTSDLETVGNLSGCKIQNGQADAKTEDELKALAPTLGEKFASDAKSINSGYPILTWQTGSIEPDPDQPESDPNGWDGTTVKVPDQTEGVYQISSAAELKWFADTAKKLPEIKGALTTDIDLNHQSWTPIAAFAGELDGQNHTIQNLYCKTNGTAGLFAQNAGTIRNLKVDGKVIGGDQTAAVAAQNRGTIENCTSMAVVKGGNYTGGITGENNGTIRDCTNMGTVRGNGKVAGIAGENKGTDSSPAKVEGGVNTGLIWSESDMVGGIVGNNDISGADFGQASVRNSANSGAIISQAAVVRSYTGGCVGRNNGSVDKLYNSGNVESRGGCTGGTLGLNLSKAIKGDVYNVGDVTGGDYEDEGYPTDNGVSSEEELALAGRDMKDVLARLSDKDAMDGSLILSGNAEVGAKIQAEYTGTRTGLIYVWYYSYDENDDAVLDITEEPTYTIPQDMGGRKLRVKILSADTKGVLKAETDTVQGLTGVLKIQGAPVVGRTLTAVFQSSQGTDGLSYQWYQGKTEIKGATESTYTVTEADRDKILKVRITSSKVAGQIEVSTTRVTTAADADMWETSECTEPANVGGVYVITNEKELHWFASEVNGGNTGISAKLANEIALTTDNWYPIGRTGHMFTGTFDGNEKKITNLKLTSTKSETGFFGLIGDGGKVQKLSLSGTVKASGDISQTGGIAGAMADRGDGKAANILDCSFTGTVNGEQQTGGIVGCVGLNNNVERCSNGATVTGTDQVGGIAGADSYGNIRYCKNTGAIGNESATQVGGIVGELQNYAELIASYNTGSVTGKDYTGGIVGKVYVAAMPLGCYNVGTVSVAVHCGGAVGSFGGDDYITGKTGSFYQGPLSPAFKANGAMERTEEQMKKASFVTELNRDAYLSCYTKGSKNINSGYPVLSWEIGGFQVTFDPGKGHCDTTSLIVEAGGSLKELPSAYRWNYRFDGWYTEEDGGDAVTGETKFQSDTTVYAHWTETRPSTGEQSKKTVYFSLSENGKYVTGKDQTLLAAVPVEVEWFDLAPYGLDQYTLKENGQVVKQPTVLHLMIRMLEKYYLGDGSTVKNNTEALKVTGNPCSLYLQKFWGHNENLIYYLNHQYPVMYEGTGATADYMTLENGDQIDLAMYSDMGFYTDPDAGFPYFAKPDGAVADSLEVTADKAETLVVHRGAADMMQGKPADKTIASAKVYSSTEIENDTAAWEDVAVTGEDGSFTFTFREPGTYYLRIEGTSVSAPGICKVTVNANPVKEAEKLIDTIGSIDQVTADSKDVIKAAREAYDALTEEQRKEVGNLKKLEDAETKYENIVSVSEAKAAIGSDWNLSMAEANDAAAVKTWLENKLKAMDLKGAVPAVTIADLTPATAGTAENKTGTDGSFIFEITLSKGEGVLAASERITGQSGVISATRYVSNDAGVKSVTVGGKAGAIEGNTIRVVLDYADDAELPTDSSAVEIVLADADAAVSNLAVSEEGAVWTFTVTAEDGTTQDYRIEVSIAENPAAGSIADIQAAKTALDRAEFVYPSMKVTDEATAKEAIEKQISELLKETDVSYEVTLTGMTAAEDGTAANLPGTEGTINFRVKLSKGEGETYAEDTVERTGRITPVPYVKSTNADVKGLAVCKIEATAGAEHTFTVMVPYGTKVTEKDFEITLADDKASVTAGPTEQDGKWKFTVTAEDETVTAVYTVTVTEDRNPAQDNLDDLAAVKKILADEKLEVSQSTANKKEAVQKWLEKKLAGMDLKGASVKTEITEFQPAKAGTSGNKKGTNGSFTVKITLTKGEGITLAEDSLECNGVIRARKYESSHTDSSTSGNPADGAKTDSTKSGVKGTTSPRTGDNSPIAGYVILLVAALAGCAVIIRKKNKNEK